MKTSSENFQIKIIDRMSKDRRFVRLAKVQPTNDTWVVHDIIDPERYARFMLKNNLM